MRFSLWSDYRMPTRTYGRSARGPSIVRKIFLTAVLFVAAVIGVRELYGQVVEKRLLEPVARPQSQLTPSANATGRRSAGVAAIPLSPQPALSADHAEVVAAAVVSHAPARTPEPSSEAAPAAPSAAAVDHAVPPALTAVPGALAKATALPQMPATFAATRAAPSFAMKAADGSKSVGARNVLHVAHRTHHDGRSLAGYAEAVAAKFGHGRELRAALQMFM
jgi:hypothetical protein